MKVTGSNPVPATKYVFVAELAYALVLETSFLQVRFLSNVIVSLYLLKIRFYYKKSLNLKIYCIEKLFIHILFM